MKQLFEGVGKKDEDLSEEDKKPKKKSKSKNKVEKKKQKEEVTEGDLLMLDN